MENGPVILITGAASGIGAAIARRVVRPGTRLTLHTRSNIDGLTAVANDVARLGASVHVVTGDLADPAVPAEIVQSCIRTYGRIDQIVSNAGKAQQATFETMQPQDLLDAFTTMPLAFFRLVKEALPFLRNSPQGRVVAIGSFVAHAFGTNNMHFPATSAAKAALEALAKSLAVQLAADGATVNCVVPGFVRKDPRGHAATSTAAMESARAITPNGTLGEHDDIAGLVSFLLSPDARHITGQSLHVDGGLLLP